VATAAVAPNWLGDFVMAAPALKALSRTGHDDALDVFALPSLAPLVRETLRVRDVIPYEKERGVGRLTLKTNLSRLLERGGYDVAVLFPNSFSSALGAWRASVPLRIGTAMHKRSALLTRTVDRMRDGEHQMDAYARIAEAATGAPVRVASDEATLSIGEGVSASAARILGEAGLETGSDGFVVVAPGAAYGPAKQWGVDNFGRLAEKLFEGGLKTVVAGTAADTLEASAIRDAAGADVVIDITGKTSLVELAGVISLSAGFAGNDSGAAHLAAALGVRTASVFLSTEPTHTAQRGPDVRLFIADVGCAPCLKRTCPNNEQVCRTAVDPADVAQYLLASRAERVSVDG
jgi:heptosyltransferase-2